MPLCRAPARLAEVLVRRQREGEGAGPFLRRFREHPGAPTLNRDWGPRHFHLERGLASRRLGLVKRFVEFCFEWTQGTSVRVAQAGPHTQTHTLSLSLSFSQKFI